MDYIKEAFSKVKQDVNVLRDEINNLKNELSEIRELLIKVCENFQEKEEQKTGNFLTNLTGNQIKESPAHQHTNPAINGNIPAHSIFFKPSNTGNLGFSTRNEGVPADRQTNQQTDRQAENTLREGIDSIENAAEMLKSLDDLKKEIYQKFKKLTEQEWLVFSTIYQFDEERGYSNYQILAEKLNLTESSIRDYVARLINKGVPIDKTKLNNKNIRLNISQSLKQIASLSTIIALRDI
ncbi:MAG: hypothetical protein Q8O84_00635 [Nanoarchaeota archaeon]|nr:hypothetical protein [Nanoarchaeota archaeon]